MHNSLLHESIFNLNPFFKYSYINNHISIIYFQIVHIFQTSNLGLGVCPILNSSIILWNEKNKKLSSRTWLHISANSFKPRYLHRICQSLQSEPPSKHLFLFEFRLSFPSIFRSHNYFVPITISFPSLNISIA